MSVLDSLCLWLGRVWSVAALLLVAAVACAVVSEQRRTRRDRSRHERLARLTAETLTGARFVAACGHTTCQQAADTLAEQVRLEAAFRAPAAERAS